MSWTYSAGAWTHTGSSRECLIAPTTELAAAEVPVTCTYPEHEVKVVRLSSGDGRWCVEVGIESTKWVMRPVIAGVPQSSFTNAASDTPASVACETNHLLGAGPVLFRFAVRLVNSTLYLYVNGSTTATLSHKLVESDFADADEFERFLQHRHWGIASDVTAARVISPQQCTLEADISPRLDGLVVVCGGNLYAVTDETGPALVSAGVFNSTGPVSLVAYQQHVYGVDGTHAKDLDFTTLEVVDWGDASGAGILPGASETAPSSGVYVPGTTRMTVLYNSGDRIGMFGDGQDPQNAFECAIGNPDDWDTGATDEPGRATALSNELSGRIGEPIVGAAELNGQSLIYACRNSLWRKTGDFALGNPLLERIEGAYGASGKNAFAIISGGGILIHSPEGVIGAGSSGGVVPISENELTTGITIDRELIDDYTVQVVRDPSRHLVYFYLTANDPGDATSSIWFAYCERTARKTGFGWFPQTMPIALGPTASCLWKGKVVLGTRDGYLITPDSDAKTDLGTAIDCNIPFSAIRQASPAFDTMIHSLAFECCVETETTDASDSVTFSVFGGMTSEMACGGTQRWTLMSGTAPLYNRPVRRKMRAPVIVLEASNGNSSTRSIRLEAVCVDAVPCRRTSRGIRADIDTSHATRSPTGDLSFPDDAATPSPGEGPGAYSPSGSLPFYEVESGFGIIFQSPFDIADQFPEIEFIPGTVASNGGSGGGNGPNPDGQPGEAPGGGSFDGSVSQATY